MSINPIQLQLMIENSQKNEKRLMEELRKSKEQSATLIQTSFKYEQEIAWLKEQAEIYTSSTDSVNDLQRSNKELQRLHSQNAKAIRDLKENLVTLQKENEELRNKYTSEKMWQVNQQKDFLCYSEIKEEHERMKTEMIKWKCDMEDLKEENEQKQKQIEELENLLKNERKKVQNTEKAFNDLYLNRQELSEMVETMKPLKQKMTLIQKEKEELEGKYQKYQEEAEAEKINMEFMLKENQTEKNKNQELSKSLLKMKDTVIDKLQRELESKNVKLEDQHQAIIKQCEIINELQMENKKLHLVIEKLQEKIKTITLNKDEETHAIEMEVRKRDGNELQMKLQIKSLQNKINLLEGDLVRVQRELQKCEKEKLAQNEIVAKQDSENKVKTAELNKIKSENCDMKEQLMVMKTHLEETNKWLKDKLIAEKEKSQLKDNLSKTVSENKQLSKELQHCKDLVVEHEKHLNLLENEKGKHEERLKDEQLEKYHLNELIEKHLTDLKHLNCCQRMLELKLEELKEKDKEIEELKCSLQFQSQSKKSENVHQFKWNTEKNVDSQLGFNVREETK